MRDGGACPGHVGESKPVLASEDIAISECEVYSTALSLRQLFARSCRLFCT
jgi:hypothetical protein